MTAASPKQTFIFVRPVRQCLQEGAESGHLLHLRPNPAGKEFNVRSIENRVILGGTDTVFLSGYLHDIHQVKQARLVRLCFVGA